MDLKNGMVIRCNSKEEAKEFIKEAYKQGFEWANHIDGCEEKTCWYTDSSEIYYYLKSNKITWSTRNFENESIEYSTLKEKIKTMTKSDLINGMVVETRHKLKGLIYDNKILFESSFVRLNDLDDNLEVSALGFPISKDGYSIDKIYMKEICNYKQLSKINNDDGLKLIWKREEAKLSNEDKQIIKKGLKKIQEECKRHTFCYDCMLYDNGQCLLDEIDSLEVDKLFED